MAIRLKLFNIVWMFFWIPALLTGPATGEAQVYRWKDAQGVLHFSDTPPAEEGIAATLDGETELPPPQTAAAVSGGEAQPQSSKTALSGLTAGPFVRGVLWAATHPGGQVSYILGTIHSDDPRVLDLPPAVTAALEKSDTFMMEVLMTPQAIFKMAQRMMLTGAEDLENVLGTPLFDRAVRAMEAKGLPSMAARKLKPWVVAMMLSIPATQTGRFLDLELHRRAVAAGKTVHGLESVDEQMDVFDQLSMEEQVAYLRETLDLLPHMPGMFAGMLSRYLDGDLQGLARIVEASMESSKTMAADQLMERLNDNRNRLMVTRMAPHLRTGGAFVAVGALHLAGEQGILNLLHQQGYGLAAVDGRL